MVPREVRKHLAIIYWFARTADDMADEGNQSDEERLGNLSDFEKRLQELQKGNYISVYESALANTIKTKNLSPEHFYNLLKAFRLDIIKKRYSDFNEVLHYCSNSANPIGRLILALARFLLRPALAGFQAAGAPHPGQHRVQKFVSPSWKLSCPARTPTR